MILKKTKKNNSVETNFSFRGKLWKHEGKAGWCFITIPKSVSKRIRAAHSSSEEGWGRLKVSATIGETTWKTSIWFDTKADSYLLPVKTLMRKKEGLAIGTFISAQVEFDP